MPSKAPALIDWLVAAFQAAPTIGAATPPVTVFDGTPTTALDPGLAVYVGLTDPDSTVIEPAVTFTQTRDDLGSLTRGEISVVHCCAEAWAGTDDLPTVRHAVVGIVAAVENLIRADTTGFAGLAAALPGVDSGELLQNNTQTGAVARMPFDITFKSFT